MANIENPEALILITFLENIEKSLDQFMTHIFTHLYSLKLLHANKNLTESNLFVNVEF